jgi:hypothetical protein
MLEEKLGGIIKNWVNFNAILLIIYFILASLSTFYKPHYLDVKLKKIC